MKVWKKVTYISKNNPQKLNRVRSGSPETMVPVAENFSNFGPQKANRRRFSTLNASTTPGPQSKQQDKEANKISAGARNTSDKVYGIHEDRPKEKSISPDNTIQVRDPAKEIFGLIRDRDREGQRHHQSNVFGTVRTHSPFNDHPNSYLDVLQQKLLGRNPAGSDSGEIMYGKVRHYQSETPPSSFETVRGMISNTKPSPNSHQDSGMFDVVRERLLNSRPRHAILNNESKTSDNNFKNLRIKSSRKRRRNVRNI